MKIEIKTPNGGALFWDMPEWNSLEPKERESFLKEIMAPNYASNLLNTLQYPLEDILAMMKNK